MPNPVLRWPTLAEVDGAVRRWVERLLASRSDALAVAYFGSYARGDWGVGSDLDLIVIVDQSGGPDDRRAAGWDTTDLPVPVDLLVYSKAEWECLRGSRYASRGESGTAAPAGDPAPEAPAPAPTTPAPAAGPARRWLELAVFAGLLAAALAAAAYLGTARGGGGSGSARPFDVIRAKTPEAAPAFELRDLAGRVVRLDDFRGRVVVLNFWATWCEPCREEMPAMMRLARDLGDRGLTVVAVNVKEGRAAVEGFVRELGLTVPVLLDSSGEVGDRYRLQALPTTYFIGRDLTLAGLALGYRDWESAGARAYLAELLDATPRSAALGGPLLGAGASAGR